MLFNSLDYALFLAVVLCVYQLLPRRGQNVLLLGASYFFYGAWDWRFLGLLALSTGVDFVVGRHMARTESSRRRRALLGVSLAVNLGVLGFFKYFDFFAENLVALLSGVGLQVPAYALDLVLPVGISFYTFQTLSYTIDIYRRQLEPTDDLVDFALFVSFFPQLVAGPIERARSLLPQIRAERTWSWTALRYGGWLILWGTFKKVYVADNIGHLVDAVFDPQADPTSMEVWLGTYGFALQVYCDFSGYSDVARGTARLLGFDLMVNFRLPYFATNPRDLWRRWHVSLSTWMRDYLYIPLGGSRKGRLGVHRNMLLTMTIGGLWHGAAWTFVGWGFLNGLFLALHRILEPTFRRVAPRSGVPGALWAAAGACTTFHLFCFALLIFRAEDFGHSLELVRLAGSWPEAGLVGTWLPTFLLLSAPLLVVQVWQALRDDLDVVPRAPLLVRSAVYTVLLAGILLLGEDHGQPFIYFQF